MTPEVCMATWATSAPELLTVTGQHIAAQVIAIGPPAGRPELGVLAGTGWLAYPGAQWQEDDLAPGVWVCAVFREPAPVAAGVTRGNGTLTAG